MNVYNSFYPHRLAHVVFEDNLCMLHVCNVNMNVKSQKFIAEEEGVYIRMGRKWMGGGVSKAAVPSITLN